MANKEMTATEKMRQKFADKALDTEQLERAGRRSALRSKAIREERTTGISPTAI